MMGVLYNVGTNTINYHLKKIFTDREVDENSVIRKFRITAADGKTYNTNHYNLSAIIAVGNKVDFPRAIQFRKWAIHGETVAETIYRRADSEKEEEQQLNVAAFDEWDYNEISSRNDCCL